MSTYSDAQRKIGLSQISLIVLGNAGSILCYLVLTEKAAKKSACLLYILAYLTSNLVLINHSIVMGTLNVGFGIDPSIHSLAYCRTKFYLSFLFDMLPTSFLILASFDRILITSSNVNTRMYSTHRSAVLVIILTSLFWSIFHLHAFFFVDIVPVNVRISMCIPASRDYTSFISYYSLIVNTILPVLLLAAFAMKTRSNLKNLSRSTQAHIRRNERYLVVLLFIQVLFYLITHGPGLGYSIYNEATKNIPKSNNQMLRELFVRFIMQYLNFIHVALTPWMNLISKNFRRRSKELLCHVVGHRPVSMETRTLQAGFAVVPAI